MLKEEFLNKIKLRYPNNFSKYDYSLILDEFRTNYDKIKIICKEHGVFEQRVALHLSGSGCTKCKNKNTSIRCRHTKDQFISKANKIHGNKYSYDKIDYITAFTKMIITCPIHGDFIQTPNDHLHSGCWKCGRIKANISKTFGIDKILHKAKLIHGDKYDYSKVVYRGIHTHVKIRCFKHGDFTQTPNNHLRGNGCPRCKDSFGEKVIASVLNKYNIKYISQYKINDYKYRYDFYLPEYNIYIEYHGRQHYEIDDFFGGIKKFKKTQRNDKIKKELIKRSSGLLIVIKHTFNNLEKIESELLRLFTILHPDFFNDKYLVKEYINKSNIYLINNGIAYKRKL